MSEAILQAGAAIAQPDVFVTYHAVSNSLSVFFDYTDVGGQANYTFTGAFASAPGNTIQGFSQTEFDARLTVSGSALAQYTAANSVTATIKFGTDPESNNNAVITFTAGSTNLGSISAASADGQGATVTGAFAKS